MNDDNDAIGGRGLIDVVEDLEAEYRLRRTRKDPRGEANNPK